MTRARDISNVITDANFSGTLDVSGAFTSQGIDDNADATAITIDSGESVFIGNTAEFVDGTGTGDKGIQLNPLGLTVSTRNGGISGIFGRQASDGTIIQLRKDGSSIGSIGSDGSDLFIDSSVSNHAGLRFAGGSVLPRYNGSLADNAVDLGQASTDYRFKDIYLSGGVRVGGTGTANLLDDYEEGTFTPTLTSSSGASRAVDAQTSRYTKIGRICYISCAITTIGALSGSNSGTLRLGGLPFNYNGSVSKSVTSSVSFVNVNLPSGIVQTAMLQNSSGTSNNFFFSSTFDNNTAGELGISAFDHTSSLVVSLVYEVA